MQIDVADTVRTSTERPNEAPEWTCEPSAGAAVTSMTIHWMNAFLHNGLGRYDEAFDAAEHARATVDDPTWNVLVLHELVEAAVRSGRRPQAERAHCDLRRATAASGTLWAQGIEARSSALLALDGSAERSYLAAIDLLGRTEDRLNEGRAFLTYGEWLRRSQRRVDARERLITAHDIFTDLHMHGFVQRAGRELMATGETARKRSDETRNQLTPQEAEIARLAGEGLTNSEIGIELFISSRTVEWHLRKIFTKLDLRSRRELRHPGPHLQWATA